MIIRALFIALLALGGTAQAADLRIFSIGALDPGMAQNVERFKKETGHAVVITNDTAPGITQRLAAGEVPDIVIAPGAVLDDAAKSGKIIVATRATVARVGVGIAVRRDAPAMTLKNGDALKEALLKADSVVYNEGSSGQYLDKLFEKMGIAEKLKAKTTKFPNGGQVGNHVIASKNNEIGFLPIPYIKTNESRGLQFIGPLPADVQNYTVYEGVVMNGSKAEAAAKDFLKFITSEAAKKTFAAGGVE
jgi:molybdate transport system substrate-binding protein